MKIKSTIIAGFLVVTSCANQAQPFVISKFYPVKAGCDGVTGASETAIVVNGYLDVAAGAPQYVLGIKVSGGDLVHQPAISLGGNVELERADRNAPLIRQLVVNYRLSKRVGPTPKPYITNVLLPFSEAGEVFGAFQVISPELGAALDGLAPSPGVAPSNVIEDYVDISVDIEFKGEFSASRTPFTTGVQTFPIRAYRSNPTPCGAGLGYVKFSVDATTTPATVDYCDYVGQSSTALIQPALPQCCTAVGPSGGAGC